MRKKKECEILIEETEFPGFGVGFYEDDKIYVKNTLPGQRVLVRITKKKNRVEAKLLEVLEDVNYKIQPKCPVFGICGGCTHQFISYETQLQFKRNGVIKLLEEAGIKDYEFLGIEGSPEVWAYRNKMEFSFGDFEKGGELCLGMHVVNRGMSIVTTDMCKIVDEDFTKIVKASLDYFRKKELPHYKIMSHEGFLRNLVIRKAKSTGEILVNIVTTSQIEFDFTEYVEILKALSFEGKLKSLIHTLNDSLSDTVQPDKVNILYGDDYIIENLLGLKFKISPFSFFQTNSTGAEKLYSLVRGFMDNPDSKVVFDLYCGTGTIGQIVAPTAKKVIGIELIEEAVKVANENAKFNGLNNCTFIAGDVAKVITQIKDKPDVIILDPPRPGVHPVALDYVIKFNAQQIIYVSCNPISLANDLKVLTENGYEVEKVICKDMFPHTPHVETVVRLKRKDS